MSTAASLPSAGRVCIERWKIDSGGWPRGIRRLPAGGPAVGQEPAGGPAVRCVVYSGREEIRPAEDPAVVSPGERRLGGSDEHLDRLALFPEEGKKGL